MPRSRREPQRQHFSALAAPPRPFADRERRFMPAPHGSSAARAEPAGTAGVELTAKVLGEDGKIVDAKTFRATDAPAAAGALNDAFRQTAAALVAWTAAATSHQ